MAVIAAIIAVIKDTSGKEWVIIIVSAAIVTILGGRIVGIIDAFRPGAMVSGHVDAEKYWNLGRVTIRLIMLDDNLKHKINEDYTKYKTYNQEGSNCYFAFADENGNFKITGIEPGTYALITTSSDINATMKRRKEANEKLKSLNLIGLRSVYDMEIEIINLSDNSKIVKNIEFVRKKYALE